MSTNYDQIDLKSLTNSALCALVEQLKEQNKSLSNRVHELDAISSKNLTLAKHFQKENAEFISQQSREKEAFKKLEEKCKTLERRSANPTGSDQTQSLSMEAYKLHAKQLTSSFNALKEEKAASDKKLKTYQEACKELMTQNQVLNEEKLQLYTFMGYNPNLLNLVQKPDLKRKENPPISSPVNPKKPAIKRKIEEVRVKKQKSPCREIPVVTTPPVPTPPVQTPPVSTSQVLDLTLVKSETADTSLKREEPRKIVLPPMASEQSRKQRLERITDKIKGPPTDIVSRKSSINSREQGKVSLPTKPPDPKPYATFEIYNGETIKIPLAHVKGGKPGDKMVIKSSTSDGSITGTLLSIHI